MDNEEDYIELHRLLAKCKFNLARERADKTKAPTEEIASNYERKIKEIDTFIINIPIIIKGDGLCKDIDQ